MKMKRMEMRDIAVGEYQFKIRPFGAKDATYIFGDVASIILPILGTVSVASDDKDAPISIGKEKSEKVRFGSVYDGLYVTDAQRQAKAELDAITLTSQSSQECLECPVSAGCGWCSGLNYEMYGTANKRFTGICWAHKARVLASAYYHNRRYLEIGDCLPIKAALPEADAQKILPLQEYDEFLLIERKALAKFADAAGIS